MSSATRILKQNTTKDLPARPDSSRERERERERERDAMRERSRSRAPSNSSASGTNAASTGNAGIPIPFPDYYVRGGLEDQRCAPPVVRRPTKEDKTEKQPQMLTKSRKMGGVPKLTIRKPEDRDPYLPEIQSATVGTPGGFASKFARGRTKTKESPTINNYPQTPGEAPYYPSSPPPPMPPRRPSEPPGSSESGQRSSSTDGRITSKLKASKAAIQQQQHKWSQKGQAAWGKITNKSNPKSAMFPPADFGNFPPQKARIDVVGMPLEEAASKTRIAKELTNGVDAAAYWLPAMVYRLISYLNVYGPREQGIYRVPGSTSAVDQMREDFARHYDIDLFQNPPDDVNTASSLLKSYIRSLPVPLLPPDFQDQLYKACRDRVDSKTPPQQFVDMISSLPPYNYYFLQALTNHLSNVALAEDVTRMGLSNLAMIFCSTMKVDRYTFNWLVGNWSDCWGGCWGEENYSHPNSDVGSTVRISFEGGPLEPVPSNQYRDDTIGLGITSNEERPPPREQKPVVRKPAPYEQQPSTGTIGKSSRKRMSGVYDGADSPAMDPERGRKRASREINWPSPAPGKTRRLSTESNSSTKGQAGFNAGSTIRQVPRDDALERTDSKGSFRMRARDRRSVDVSQLAALAQQASLGSPVLDSPASRFRNSPYGGNQSPRTRDSPTSRNLSGSQPGTPDGHRMQKQRARSAERSGGLSPRPVELLPPMPPVSPLMASGNGGHSVF